MPGDKAVTQAKRQKEHNAMMTAFRGWFEVWQPAMVHNAGTKKPVPGEWRYSEIESAFKSGWNLRAHARKANL